MNPITVTRFILGATCIGMLLSLHCTQPQPGPAPVPTPVADAAPVDAPVSDIFTGRIFNCHLDIVATERDSAMPDVKRCLVLAGAASCLVHQASQYQPDTVACVARDMGARANAAVLAGSTDALDELIAAQARGFISSERLGYK